MYSLVLYLPLFNALFLLLIGRFLGRKGASILSLLSLFLTMITSYFIVYEIGFVQTKILSFTFNWLSSGSFFFNWDLYFDAVTATMLIVVSTISFVVHLYSIEYMSADPHLIRFLAYLSLFTFFMLVLVTSSNYINLFLGWEGVGIASYLLINFWSTRIQANKSALKAVILNRFGDIALSIAIFSLFSLFASVNFFTIFSLLHLFDSNYFLFLNWEFNSLYFILIFLFLGTVGKSAQLGLHTWLPDAMEGPTPVSALIHAATMVTAGVFLLIRSGPLLEYCTSGLVLIAFVGAFTSFFAGTVGIFQNDLKKVIAYSTCSQLGYMVLACGMSEYSLSLFHLMNHAFFKGLLFLSAGVIIHALSDEQDMRRMGGFIKFLPFSYVSILIGSLALAGFPFLSGFYSKDIILEIAYVSYLFEGRLAYFFAILAVMCTSWYSFRLIFLVFFQEISFNKVLIKNISEGSLILLFPLFLLSFFSIFIGFLAKEAFIGIGSDFWNGVVHSNTNYIALFSSEYLYFCLKLIPFIFTIFAGILSFQFYTKDNVVVWQSLFYKDWYSFFSAKWFFDGLYNLYFGNSTLSLGYFITYRLLDRGFVELYGPTGLVRFFQVVMKFFTTLHTGLLSSIFIYLINFLILGSALCLIS